MSQKTQKTMIYSTRANVDKTRQSGEDSVYRMIILEDCLSPVKERVQTPGDGSRGKYSSGKNS